MTRGYQFTLPVAGVNYNLWSLIDATRIDITAYLPKTVCNLKIKFPLVSANAGAYLSVRGSGGEMDLLVSDGVHQVSALQNVIELEAFNLNGDTNNVVVDISITAR